MKKLFSKEIIFCIFILSVSFCIACFNFIVDPYTVLSRKENMELIRIPNPQQLHIAIKAYKDRKCDTLFLGSSEMSCFFVFKSYFYSFFFNYLQYPFTSYKQEYQLLKDYLHFHPETKTVYLFLGYNAFFAKSNEREISVLKGDNFNLNEWVFLLFSLQTTMESFSRIKDNPALKNYIINFIHYISMNEEERKTEKSLISLDEKIFRFNRYPKFVPLISLIDEESLKKTSKEDIEDINNIVKLLKEKNINLYIVFPPSHAIYQSIIYKRPFMQNFLDDLKRLSVEWTDNDVYDFAVINKYTASDYLNNNYLFSNLDHSNGIYGINVFKMLHNNINKDGICIRLNKQNIEKQLIYEKELVKKYIEQNNETVDIFLYGNENLGIIATAEPEKVTFEKAPEDIRKDIELYLYNFKKINEKIENKSIEQGRFDNEFYPSLP